MAGWVFFWELRKIPDVSAVGRRLREPWRSCRPCSQRRGRASKSRRALTLENLALRQQLVVLRRRESILSLAGRIARSGSCWRGCGPSGDDRARGDGDRLRSAGVRVLCAVRVPTPPNWANLDGSGRNSVGA